MQHDHIPETSEAGGMMRFFILRPVFGMLLVVLIIAGGLMAYASLIKESLPDLAIPQATITTFWPGADPQTVEQEVTEKIENELSSLRGVKKINSASFDSYSMIAVEFIAEADLGESRVSWCCSTCRSRRFERGHSRGARPPATSRRI
jgi:multidrug efflux pump subunit AcrB